MGQGNPKSTMQVDLADLREQLDSLEDELPPPLPPTAPEPSPAGATKVESEAQAVPRPSSIPAPPEMNSSRIAVLVAVVVGSVVLALVVAQLLFGGEDPASTPSDRDSNAAAESGTEDLAEEDLPTIELGEIEVDDMAGEAENSAENNPDPENAASDGQ